MDADRFDTLARSLTGGGSRRHALTGLVAGALGLLGARAEEAIAHDLKATCKKKSGEAKKKCLKKAKQHAAQHATETSTTIVIPPPGAGVACTAVQNGTNACQNGTCVITCNSGFTLCGSTCLNTASDPRNCGACGKRCQVNATCSAGSCS